MGWPRHEVILSLFELGMLSPEYARREFLNLVNADNVDYLMSIFPQVLMEGVYESAASFRTTGHAMTFAGSPPLSVESSIAISKWIARRRASFRGRPPSADHESV